MTILYAWAIPAFVSGAPVDHTWVTSYDNRLTPYPQVSDVAANGQCYWFCWGSYHPQAAANLGALGSQAGDLARAQCLVLPNQPSLQAPPARGTVFSYGVDGVCHQLANQVLLSTRMGAAAPLTVRAARGYQPSLFIYGTYGLQALAWTRKISLCAGIGGPAVTDPEVMGLVIAEEKGFPVANSASMDEFELHLRKTLGAEHAQLAEALLDLRQHFQSQAKSARDPQAAAPTAEELNARNQKALDAAAKLLGRDRFIAVFGFPPEQKIHLVDTAILDSSLRE